MGCYSEEERKELAPGFKHAEELFGKYKNEWDDDDGLIHPRRTLAPKIDTQDQGKIVVRFSPRQVADTNATNG